MRGCPVIVAVCLVLSLGCDKRSPDHDQAPVIRNQFGRLQAALQDRNVGLIDSLVSSQLTDDGLSVDSLIRFVWGANADTRFDHFGPNEIIYNRSKARMDCPLVDSSGQMYRSVTWTLVRENDTWLLKRFESGLPSIDSVR